MKMTFTESTKYLKVTFNSIIRLFIGFFCDNKMFVSKIRFCDLIVKETANSTIHTMSEIRFSQQGYVINMCINLNDDLSYIVLQFAHEICHLICMPFSASPYAEYNQSDDSYALTTLTRRTSKLMYGATFEEAFCNFVAIDAVTAICTDEKNEYIFKMVKQLNIVSLIVGAFSSDSYEHWDECFDNTLKPKNLFLFGVATGSITQAIIEYDNIHINYTVTLN